MFKEVEAKEFSPTLYPNKIAEVKDGKLVIKDKDKTVVVKQQDYFVSTKWDGVRILVVPNIGLLTRSLKPVQNKNIHEKLKPIIDWVNENNILLDGELYDPTISFQEIISVVMTQGTVKEVPKNFKFYIFDCLDVSSVEMRTVIKRGKEVDILYVDAQYDMPFLLRMEGFPNEEYEDFKEIIRVVKQELITPGDYEKLNTMFREALEDGNEGLILKSVNADYKLNRTTIKESTGFKFKEKLTEDMEIIGVVQATIVREGSEKKVNQLGRSVTSKKKDDRVLVNKASAFKVRWNGNEFKVSIAENDVEKEKIWLEREKYIGEFVETEFMLTGSKDGIPRHPVSKRMRWRKYDE